jgi:bacterioferritin-associated ferredoxin
MERSMIICICEGINDERIKDEIRQGADSVGAIARSCGAGTGCGLCSCDLKRFVLEARTGSPDEVDAVPSYGAPIAK